MVEGEQAMYLPLYTLIYVYYLPRSFIYVHGWYTPLSGTVMRNAPMFVSLLKDKEYDYLDNNLIPSWQWFDHTSWNLKCKVGGKQGHKFNAVLL